jgi:hypothetical protein
VVEVAGVGAINPQTKLPAYCCDPTLISAGECSLNDLGKLVLYSSFEGTVIRLPVSPKGAYSLEVPEHDDLVYVGDAGNYVVMLANCDPRGRNIEVQGGIQWSDHDLTNNHKDTASDRADEHSKAHEMHKEHQHTVQDTIQRVTDKVSSVTGDEVVKAGIVPLIIVPLVGLCCLIKAASIVRRRRQVSGYDQIEMMDDLKSFEGGYQDNPHSMDTEFLDPNADLPDQPRRPQTSFSSRL